VQTLFDLANRRGAAETAPVNTADMTREQVVDRIITMNPSATRRFLDHFEPSQLRHYLDHLIVAMSPRGPNSQGWIRPGNIAAITVCEAAD